MKNPISRGIDISAWQGEFDLARAKEEGFFFAVLKGGGGDAGLYADGRFPRNYRLARSLGMSVGAYWYSRAMTPAEAEAEAEYFYQNCLKGRQFALPVYVDIEDRRQLSLGKRQLTDIVHAWCQYLEARGFWVGIYSSISVFETCLYDSELERYAHWVACWARDCDYAKPCFGLWQYGGETNLLRSNQVAGQTCDQDLLLVDYPACIPRAGKNGFGPADFVSRVQQAIGAVADGVPGPETLSKTPTVSRYVNQTHPVVALVQERLGELGYDPGKVDGIAGPLFDGALRAFQRDNGCVSDGELTAGCRTWKTLLGKEKK